MKNSFTRNLQIGFGLSLLLLIISSAASYISINNLLKSTERVNHTSKVILEVESIISTLKDAETGQRGYLLTDNPKFLDPYNGAYNRALATLDNVKTLTADNPVQQQNCDELKELVTRRFGFLQQLIDVKKATNTISTYSLEQGKIYMDSARLVVKRMQEQEQGYLRERTANMDKFSTSTPILIVFAAIISLIITVFFYNRVRNDFIAREKLQKELQLKDEEITRRIAIIQNIAEKIASGNYHIRVNDDEKDDLGSLAVSMNSMAESLDYSFGLLSEKEWLQTGIAQLNEKMVGEKDIDTLSYNIVDSIVTYSGGQAGALYIKHDDKSLKLAGSYGLNKNVKTVFNFGEGIVGQAAMSAEKIILNDLPEESFQISFASGAVRPKSIVAFPIFHEGAVIGVVELASLTDIADRVVEFLKSSSDNIGIAINSAQSRKRLKELLEETQSQSEELQAQHSELENINAELEIQAQKLQASEEELRVQQEELLQSNQEMEERSRLLEEKNQVIVERNLEIQKKAEELELSTKYKSEFLANMSHELRTPLNSVLLLSRLLAENNENNLTQEQVESARVIQSSGTGLLSLIDEILDLSKIEAGKMPLEYAQVAMSEVANDMKQLFNPIAKEKNLELKINIDANAPHTAETDKMRLEQILKNLISNALKFTRKGYVQLDIAADPKDAAFIRFSVKDTGIGIPAEKQQIIFEAFHQADGSTRRMFGGTGLGLSISRELAKLLGGEISVSSAPGQGSEFVVIVPVQRPVNEPGTVVSEAYPEVFPASFPEPVSDSRQKFTVSVIPEEIPDDRKDYSPGDKVILIIEDDTIFAKALLNFARKSGYKGIVAVRGDQGIELAQQFRPRAILLDIQLPVKDGWEVMEDLKTNVHTRHIPVHIMSSMEVKRESLLKGAVDFINKPIALEQMHSIFKKLEEALSKGSKKVLIVEENPKHARALSYFLESFNVNAEIRGSVNESVDALKKKEVDCVILDMGIPDKSAYETLEVIKKNPGLEDLPIIVFTGKSLSVAEESRIKQYADSIVMKTAHSYQRILDEVGLFLHLIEEANGSKKENTRQRSGVLREILRGKTVLIADDDARNIFSLAKALEQHKMKVISATDGKEALRRLEENPQVDLVLMDMMMPEMDGYESTSQIRKNPKYKNLPILAVTAKAMMGDREKCIEAGASDYISKPVDIDQLISLLRVWLYDKTI